jgi:hypothetical protein
MKREYWVILGVLVVAAVAYVMWKKGVFNRKGAVTPPAVGVRSAVGSNIFSVADRMFGANVMSNLNAPVSTPVAAGPVPNGSPAAPASFFQSLRLVG